MPARTVEAHRRLGDDQITDQQIRLDRTRGAHPQERPHAELGQLLDRDRGRRPADTSRADHHRLAVDRRSIGREFPHRGQVRRLVHRLGNPRHPGGIARHDRKRGSAQIGRGHA